MAHNEHYELNSLLTKSPLYILTQESAGLAFVVSFKTIRTSVIANQ